MTAQELASFATISAADEKLATRLAHPSLKPFLEASSVLPKIKGSAIRP